jgi:predicted permease
MRIVHLALATLRALVRRNAVADEIREEMRFHVRMRAEEYRRAGLDPAAARREASRRVGNMALLHDRGYNEKGAPTLEAFGRSLRGAVRGLRRDAGLSLAAVTTLALGVGVVTAAFAVVNAVLLRPLVDQQDEVVRIWQRDAERGLSRDPFSYFQFMAFRDRARSFSRLAAIQYADATLISVVVNDRPTTAMAAPVSAEFLPMLSGGSPLHGRWMEAADEVKGAEVAAIVSERFWRRVANGDPGFVGQRLQLGGLSFLGGQRSLVVVGVAPAGFDYPIGADVWVPIVSYFSFKDPKDFAHFELVGRLAPGVSVRQAAAELESLSHSLAAEVAAYRPMPIVVQPLIDAVVGSGRRVLSFLLAGGALVLTVAGVNVAALLLMRSAVRRRERAVRLALGATRTRLAVEDLLSSLLLGAAAGGAGIFVGSLLLALLRWIGPEGVPRIDAAVLDVKVLAFAAAAIVVWVVTLGAAPVIAQRHIAPKQAGDLSSRGHAHTTGLWLFTVLEAAIAVVLAIGAGLLIRSFVQLQAIDRGFDSRNLAVIPLLLPNEGYPKGTHVAFYEDLISRINALPGVIAATSMHTGPGTGVAGLSASMEFEGQTPAEAAMNPWATFDPVLPSSFQTLGIPIVQGRAFDARDRQGNAGVAIVSASVARRYWPGQNPLGKQLRVTDDSAWVEVVGVAGDLRYRELTRDWLTVYFPAAQFFFFEPSAVVVRTASRPEHVTSSIEEAIRAREPGVAIGPVSTMDAALARETARPRMAFAVMLVFAVATVLLAAIGVYGVMSYEVSHRRHELAVRSALGASPHALFRAVVRRSTGMAAVGMCAGVLLAALGGRWLKSLLYEVDAHDPSAFLTGAGILLVAALLAACVPAARAARTDPAAVLRSE